MGRRPLQRAESQKLCTLVVIGVNERGEKQFLAIEDGVRESIQSWRDVLLKLQARELAQKMESKTRKTVCKTAGELAPVSRIPT